MRISLERDSARDRRPVYRQIADQIRAQIEAERLAAGDRLPPIRDLARDLGVNRDTVALAYESLAETGVIESAVGRGTFVTEPLADAPDEGPFEARFSTPVDRLLDFERGRPHFGTAEAAVPMHSLIPDPSLYPLDPFRRALNRVLQDGGPEMLLYATPQGDASLRAVLAERLGRAGIAVTADEIVLCHGASQGISLALRLFASPGDVVALEEPTYNNALAAAVSLGLETAPVPMREGGMDLAVLERTLARPEVKALYTIPTFHNPLGTTTNLSHRRAVLDIARRHGVPIVEDGYEMDLRFSGRSLPPLAGLDTSGLVVHVFSFSKSLFPGARVGAMTARGRTVDALLALKQASDLSDGLPLQAALAAFLKSGEYDRHLARMRRVLRERRDALLEALEREMPEGTTWTTPEGGYQVWVELPEAIDTRDLLTDAIGVGVLFAPGSQFNHDGRASRGLRLTFAMAESGDLRLGVARLARCVKDRLDRRPRTAGVHI
ncbi:MAG: PLP-dependent aminotransferase family protein [Myxococcota bacterium]